ncbi:hypothetical protein D9V41_03130 [Aeromicrobium phragmitis]|uniref:Sigma-70 family RNA polymerase sigma factor n=1 Tax=Aeromicrobium phragmitis TaxID=2478914 RepID=A0A3L8PN15_9ACTN|nr:hypothetical protein [Aeromicrobium phragmitis]RLV56787.1 hypothetical protein D9V41_03130 [Aeromicrobium phragmitis]
MTFADARSRDDASLLEATREGDHAAFSELFERHRAAVERLAESVTRGRDAETLVSAAFIEGLGRVLDGAATDAAFRPWILRVVMECHGTSFASTTASAAFWSLPVSQQSLIWSAVVDDAPADSRALAAASDALRAEFLRRQREDASSRHARTHLDDLEGHADTCATCLGVWWSADDLTSATSLARSVLGVGGERYLRQPAADRRRRRPRPRWIPATFVASVAAMLLATSLGALAVAHWGPGNVAAGWRTSAPTPTPAPTAAPSAGAPAPPSPDATATPRPEPTPSSEPPPAPSPSPVPSPTARPSEEPSVPEDMAVGFAFGDPHDEYVTRNGTAYQARHIRFHIVAEDAQGTHARAVMMRFEFAGAVTYLDSSSALSCTPSAQTITCTTSLAPGNSVSGTITVEHEQGSGRARVHTSDDPSAATDHVFDFGPWAGTESASPSAPPPPPNNETTEETTPAEPPPA